MNFENVRKLLDNALAKDQVPCSDVSVTYRGKAVYRYQNGSWDDQRCAPLKGDELYFLYSATKVITCTALLQLLGKWNFTAKTTETGFHYPGNGENLCRRATGI